MASQSENCAAATAAPAAFKAKEENRAGMAAQIAALQIADLRVIAGDGEMALYSRDQSDVPSFLRDMLLNYDPDAVVQPSTSEAAAAVMRFANEKGITIIPRGSASSPFGGAIPVNGGLVIDTGRMDRIVYIDAEKKEARVQSGVRWADLEHELGRKGLRLATSPSSMFSTVGGWVAGGGIGIGALGHGHLSNLVTSLQVVIPDGRIVTMTPGTESFEAAFGSEGQIGLISEVTIKVKDAVAQGRPHLLLFKKQDDAMATAVSLLKLNILPEDMIYFSDGKLRYANKLLGKEHFAAGHALLVTTTDKASEEALLPFIINSRIREEPEYQARLLMHERYFPMKLRRLGPGMLGAEVLAPTKKLDKVIGKALELCQTFDLDPLLEVHFLNGPEALVLCYYLTDQSKEGAYMMDAVKSMIITQALMQLGSRPYSLGVWNNTFVDKMPAEEMDRLRKVKAELDPKGLMNKGKFLKLHGRSGGIPSKFLTPAVAGTGLKFANLFQKPAGPVLRMATKAASGMGVKKDDELMLAADQCAMCGACVAVCPAYLVVGDERVTARGKLATARVLDAGGKVSKEHAHRTFLCMRCHACEQVCQSKLELLPLYDKLEEKLEKAHGKDVKEIDAFIKFTELRPEYDALLQKGLVIGSPKFGMRGGGRDV
jgi:FAD/FMN-containing dehydrogenase/ferredoxin